MFSTVASQQRYQLTGLVSRPNLRLKERVGTLSLGVFVLALFVLPLNTIHAQTRRSSQALSMDDRAAKEAHEFWNAKVTTCGEDSYTLDRNYIHDFRGKLISVTKTT